MHLWQGLLRPITEASNTSMNVSMSKHVICSDKKTTPPNGGLFEDAVTTLLSSFGLQICDVTHLKIG